MNAIITGATKGIGRATAELFAKQGINLAICSRSAADLEDCKNALRTINEQIEIIYMPCDVSKKNEVLAFANFVKSKWSEIDVLINNAGIFLPGEILLEADGHMESQMETNLYSAYHLTRFCMPWILKSKQAHIFNICSVASILAYPNGGSYSISKYALLGFSKVLREELKTRSVKVTSVLPGATWSFSWKGADFPEDRLMQAEDIAIAIGSALQMSPSAVVEEILIRPQLGDL
jgi:short-subunit dehydrogenase